MSDPGGDLWAAIQDSLEGARLSRIVVRIATATLVCGAAIYAASFAGLLPSGAVLATVFSIGGVTMATFTHYARKRRGMARVRWWMPVIAIAFVANMVILESHAEAITHSGSIVNRGDRNVLVSGELQSKGQVIRELDENGVQEIRMWEYREFLSGTLILLALALIGLVAYSDHGVRQSHRPLTKR